MTRRAGDREARDPLSPCRLCPRGCGVDRAGGELGACRTGLLPKVASVAVHHGEEPPLSGQRGAGNVFLSGCNLACRFCQNYPISQLGVGSERSLEEVAAGMLDLERRGVHLVNLVTPSHVTPQVVVAVAMARAGGLRIPVAWNSNGYESPATLRLLEGTIDVWLPDLKYDDDGASRACSGVADYARVAHAAIDEMVRQSGPLRVGDDGIARSGVLVRHLVLPGGLSGTRGVLKWLSNRHPEVPVSLMFQYFPAYRAVGDPLLGRRPSREECLDALAAFEESGLEGWCQELPGEESARFREGISSPPSS